MLLFALLFYPICMLFTYLFLFDFGYFAATPSSMGRGPLSSTPPPRDRLYMTLSVCDAMSIACVRSLGCPKSTYYLTAGFKPPRKSKYCVHESGAYPDISVINSQKRSMYWSTDFVCFKLARRCLIWNSWSVSLKCLRSSSTKSNHEGVWCTKLECTTERHQLNARPSNNVTAKRVFSKPSYTPAASKNAFIANNQFGKSRTLPLYFAGLAGFSALLIGMFVVVVGYCVVVVAVCYYYVVCGCYCVVCCYYAGVAHTVEAYIDCIYYYYCCNCYYSCCYNYD